MTGLYWISEQVGNVYQLELPPNVKMYDIFSPNKLRKAANNPLPRQIWEPPESIKINNDQEWEVEQAAPTGVRVSALAGLRVFAPGRKSR